MGFSSILRNFLSDRLHYISAMGLVYFTRRKYEFRAGRKYVG